MAIFVLFKMKDKTFLTGAILGDYVGLGKIVETIGAFLFVLKAEQLWNNPPWAESFLVVIPPTLIIQSMGG